MAELLAQYGDRFDWGEDFLVAAEKLTTEDWEILTKGWQKIFAFFAHLSGTLSVKKRQEFALETTIRALFEQLDSNVATDIGDFFLLSDEALNRLNTALRNNELSGDLRGPGRVYD